MKGYQLKITIKGSKPPIWRRVIVPERISFHQLHQTIQMAFGWEDCHLHDFAFPAAGIRVVDSCDEMGDMDWFEKELIDDLVVDYPRFVYTYDFGDCWEHQIVMEKEVEYPHRYPTVVKYKGDNLPEDCGGIWGYYSCLEELETELFDLEAVNCAMETELVFGPGKKRTKKRDIAHVEAESAGVWEDEGPYFVEDITEIYIHYTKDELKRIAKLQRLKGYSEMDKNTLIQELAGHVQKKEVMERYFRCADDKEIQEFERAAARAGELCDLGNPNCEFLRYGGYCGQTRAGELVVPSSVALAYQAVNTEKFHKCRKRSYQVLAYMTAAVYLYGVAADNEITALHNLYESEKMTTVELHSIFREIQGVRDGFKYKNGFFFDRALEKGDDYYLVQKKREGKKAFIPSKEMVLEIAENGYSEPLRQLVPWVDFISSTAGLDTRPAYEIAKYIHFQIRYGHGPQDVVKILEEVGGVVLDTEEERMEFEEVFQRTWNQTRMVSNYGFTPGELAPAVQQPNMDDPCPCGSGKRYRQCCGRKKA